MRGSVAPVSSSWTMRADQVPGRRRRRRSKTASGRSGDSRRRPAGRGRAGRSAPSRSDCRATGPRSRPAPRAATCRAASDAPRDWPAPRRSSRSRAPITATSSTIERNGNSLPPTRSGCSMRNSPVDADRRSSRRAGGAVPRRAGRARAAPGPAPRRATRSSAKSGAAPLRPIFASGIARFLFLAVPPGHASLLAAPPMAKPRHATQLRHCEERVARRGNLDDHGALARRLLRFARNDGWRMP